MGGREEGRERGRVRRLERDSESGQRRWRDLGKEGIKKKKKKGGRAKQGSHEIAARGRTASFGEIRGCQHLSISKTQAWLPPSGHPVDIWDFIIGVGLV